MFFVVFDVVRSVVQCCYGGFWGVSVVLCWVLAFQCVSSGLAFPFPK